MEESLQLKIRRIFNDNLELRFTTEDIAKILGKKYSLSGIRVTISRLKSEDYGYKSYPRLDLVNYSEDYKTAKWGVRGAKEDYDESKRKYRLKKKRRKAS